MYLPRDSFPFRNSILNDFYFLILLYMKYLGIWFDRVHLRKRIDSYRSICGSDAVGRLYTELHYSRNSWCIVQKYYEEKILLLQYTIFIYSIKKILNIDTNYIKKFSFSWNDTNIAIANNSKFVSNYISIVKEIIIIPISYLCH